MNRIERELYDLEEYLRRNDDSADSSTYLTIVGIANEVSELESENIKLRNENNHLIMNSHPTATELRRVRRAWEKDREENARLRVLVRHLYVCKEHDDCRYCPYREEPCNFKYDMRELKIEVDG
jgi:hypothetical protein